ncbi:conserved hypothetical protein [Leishmania braziliensis MHOM/BR/75/M2904]|uniref:Uncharacterized protein n=2 Tax=Leishmania braziliensis TaxID=5660 RepID=A4H3H5_LEIBR|nr:conserved hypothetical protein [Leishmania braziliensis MHOM/BR/75/M2904]CAJ2465839.1 unnamed protein product [Leishmania braziliensis]CAM36740.1 conserved hypothetical protein [Leishmania braziliensis MHOM/BR/75/M2904]SYZ62465.1 hypothetical_protein [Leishmania braziliensis MHOM/BR/75/M2904]
MTNGAAEKKHLVPLLEFLRFASEHSRSEPARFPKRINGVSQAISESSDSGVDPDSLSLPREFHGEVTYSSSNDRSSSASRDNAVFMSSTQERRKRSRSVDEISESIVGSTVPMDCELDVMTAGKGCVTSKYFDFSLLDLGVQPIIASAVSVLTKDVAKQVQGMRCCYVLPGTSMVVTGDIVDVSVASETVLVSPDRGLRVGLEWISIRRVFQVPKNILAVRGEAALRIQRIIDAERRGEKTPRFSPVQLAESAEDASSSESSISHEEL